MNDLEKLGKKYGTDKGTKHHYLSFYYDFFKDKRNEVKKVIEIGVGEGAGLRMWRDFFPNAKIYGMENQKVRIFQEGRIQVLLADQSSARDIADLVEILGPGIDLVVDDGSHDPADQLFACLGIMNLLKKEKNPSLVYVIEDVADLDLIKYLSEKYATNMIECGKRYDDRLVVVKHL